MRAIKDLEVTIEQNNALILQLQEQNQKFIAMIEKIKAIKPTKEKFGWVDADGFESQGGWAYEGCEEAYIQALQKWEADFGN